jgi:hypothetical protein
VCSSDLDSLKSLYSARQQDHQRSKKRRVLSDTPSLILEIKP